MQNKSNYIIGLSVFALVICVILFAVPYTGHRTPVATPGQTLPPEVVEIQKKLILKTMEYGAKTQRQIDLGQEIATLENDKAQLAKSAASYDAVLCNEYGMHFVRPTADSGSGTILKGCADAEVTTGF